MVRKLAFAVSLALGTLSVPAHALGLGDLSSKSTLNQNFQGDITLLSVEAEELDAVRVRLADAEAFSRAGVDRPFYLSLLKFEPTLTAKGKPVIRVTSEFPIREPFINFLIEVNWPNGRLLREYTVLLDPPTTTMRRPSPVAAPTKTAPAAAPKSAAVPPSAPTTAAPAPQPSTAGSAGVTEYGPVKANETAWSIAKRLRPRGVSMEQMMMALLDANPQAFLDGNVNLLRKGQILRVPSVAEIQELSRQDARQAYRQQQDEWLARRNQRLQQAAESDTSAQAAADDRAAGPAETADQLRIATARPEGSGEAGAGDDDAHSPTASDLTSRLMVARENAETTRQEAENLRTRVDELQARLADMQRLLSLKDEQLAQLQDRVGLEQDTTAVAEAVEESPAAEEAAPDVTPADAAAAQTADAVQAEAPVEPVEATSEPALEPSAYAQSVAPPEDYAIADIPPQIDADRIVAAADAEAAVSAAAPGAEVTPESSGEAVTEPPAAPSVEGEVVVIEDAADVVTAQAPVEPATEAAAPTTFEPPAVPTSVTEPPPETAEPVAPAKSDSLIPAPLARILEQNMLPIAGGGIALLALIGLMVARRRRKSDDGDAVSAAAAGAVAEAQIGAEPESGPEAAAVDKPVISAETLADLPDSAFLDELSPADLNALQDETGEVDPVSEADVYIAYGRYQQAEELLRQAMQRDPGRLALRHKLLEVHYATRDADAFVSLAQSMADAGQDQQDAAAWTRAQDMGRELAPENPLFARAETRGAPAVAGAIAAGAATVDEDTLSLDDLEMSELEAAYEEDSLSSSDLEMPSEVSISLDLEDEAPELAQPTETAVPEGIPLEELESVDFELPEVEVSEAQEVEAEQFGSDTLDLESMMAEAEAAVDQDESVMNLDSEFSAEELQAQLDELSELSVLAPELDDSAESQPGQVRGGLGLVAEDRGAVSEDVDEPFNLDSEFSVDEGEDEMPEFLAINDSSVPAEPVSEDEVSTKLDLARAYFEMGDDDGARSILEEVVAEGTDSQRGDAEQMLAKMG